jgi:TRAP-type C4-dicarboxylate transport system substrate-binding protein
MRAGIVPFGTIVLGTNSSSEPEFGAVDLAGLSPDIKAVSRVVNAFRPHLQRALRDRYDVELLAVYVYPAQMLFCKQPLTGLKNLAGRRIRTAQPSVSDFVKALGATPVRIPFADINANMRSGNVDCAITGSMSGNAIGLQALTTHIYSMPLSWGLSVFGANTAAWQALPADVRTLLRAELSQMEATIWADAERDTLEGVKCDIGSPECVNGKKGTMIEVKPTVADDQLRQHIFTSEILPMWVKRCGPDCVDVWNQTLKPVTGIEAVGK